MMQKKSPNFWRQAIYIIEACVAVRQFRGAAFKKRLDFSVSGQPEGNHA
jgi:hypothetical protein